MKCLSLILLLLVTIGNSFISYGMAAQGNLTKGKALYGKYCEKCHGADGTGGYLKFDPPAADLTAPDIQMRSDYPLWESIHQGVVTRAMGSWKWVLSDEDGAHLLTYVQSLDQ